MGPAMLLALIAALGVGVTNGMLSTYGKINAIIAHARRRHHGRGHRAASITGGQLVRVDDPAYSVLGRGELLGIKHSVWLLAGTIIVCSLILWITRFGRYIYASGGNAEAARLAGVRVRPCASRRSR